MTSIVFDSFLFGEFIVAFLIIILSVVYTFFYTYLYSRVRIDKTVTFKTTVIKYIILTFVYPFIFIGASLGLECVLSECKIHYAYEILIPAVVLATSVVYFTVTELLVFKSEFSLKTAMAFLSITVCVLLIQLAAILVEMNIYYIMEFTNYSISVKIISKIQFYSTGVCVLVQSLIMFIPVLKKQAEKRQEDGYVVSHTL